jgi:hypothetical protein
LEIAAAIAVWVHGAAIATGRLPVVGTRLITRLGVASIVLAMNRPTSLLWLGLIGVLLLISAGRETISELLRHTASRLWAVGLAIAIALQVSWSAWADAFNVSKTFVGGPVNVTRAQYFRTTIGNSYQLLREMIGLFGWLDTYAPALTYLLWFLGIAALIAVALLVAPRLLRTLAATVILVIAVPIVVEATYVHTIGFQWQGRYTLPLAVGVPILAGLGIGLARDHISRSSSPSHRPFAGTWSAATARSGIRGRRSGTRSSRRWGCSSGSLRCWLSRACWSFVPAARSRRARKAVGRHL